MPGAEAQTGVSGVWDHPGAPSGSTFVSAWVMVSGRDSA